MYEIKSDLRQNAEKYKKQVNAKLPGILAKMAVSYGAKALQYVPPGMTSKKAGTSGKRINPKFYERPWIYLPDLRGTKKLSKFDYEMMGKKLYYRLSSNRPLPGASSHFRQVKTGKKALYYYYFKTARPLKKYIKIKNRGLLKVMFGLNLQSIGEAVPRVIQSLLKKSKNLLNLVNLNRFTKKQNGDEASLKIENLAFTALAGNNLQEIVNRNAEKYAKQTAKKQFKKLQQEKINL